MLSLKVLNPVIPLLSYAAFTSLLTYNVLITTQPACLHNLVSVQPARSTHCSSLVTLDWLPTSSSLRITDHSFRYASPCLWNQLLLLFISLIPCSLSVSDLPLPSPVTSSSLCVRSPLLSSIIEVARWCNSKAFGLAISRSRVQILLEATLCNNLRQVVYTYVPLSSSSIT